MPAKRKPVFDADGEIARPEPAPVPEAPKPDPMIVSTWGYSRLPTSRAMLAHIKAMPKLPADWNKFGAYSTAIGEWHDELQAIAFDTVNAADGATGLMADLMEGRRKIDDASSNMLAMVIAIRA